MALFKDKYRIVRDNYCGYEVQVKKWWFPFCWFQCGGDMYDDVNTHFSTEKARAHIEKLKTNKKKNYVIEVVE